MRRNVDFPVAIFPSTEIRSGLDRVSRENMRLATAATGRSLDGLLMARRHPLNRLRLRALAQNRLDIKNVPQFVLDAWVDRAVLTVNDSLDETDEGLDD